MICFTTNCSFFCSSYVLKSQIVTLINFYLVSIEDVISMNLLLFKRLERERRIVESCLEFERETFSCSSFIEINNLLENTGVSEPFQELCFSFVEWRRRAPPSRSCWDYKYGKEGILTCLPVILCFLTNHK